jgi:hypothetical protein
MGSKSRGSGSGGTGQAQQAPANYSFNGQSGMTQQAANDAYAKAAADWRAPTTSAPMTAAMQKNPVSYTPSAAFGSDGGPKLPGAGVPLAAPTAQAQSFTPTPQAQFLLAMGADPKLLLGKNYNAWASTPVTRGSLAGAMQQGGGQRYGSRASRYKAGGHR